MRTHPLHPGGPDPYYQDSHCTIYLGDCRDVLPTLDPADTVLTDPPYGLGFMGKDWDHGVPGAHFWELILAATKPGAMCFAFGGTRTWHRLAVAIEDAGWELRDTVLWLYGSGFPKSLDIGKAIDKARHDREQVLEVTSWIRAARDAVGLSNAEIDAAFGFNGMAGHWTSSASQPAVPTLEQVPHLLAVLGVEEMPQHMRTLLLDLNGRKGQPGENWFKRKVVGQKRAGIAVPGEGPRHTVGGSRSVEVDITAPATDAAKTWDGWGTALKPAYEPILLAMHPLAGTFAQNALTHGVAGLHIDGGRIPGDEDGSRNRPPSHLASSRTYAQDEWTQRTIVQRQDTTGKGRWPANVIHDGSPEVLAGFPVTASRQRTGKRTGKTTGILGAYVGQDEVTMGHTDSGSAARFFYTAKASPAERHALTENGNDHPTVKPLALMAYLARLSATPTGGVILDPFMGSGTTLLAAKESGRRAIGIDLDERHCEIAAERLAQGVLNL